SLPCCLYTADLESRPALMRCTTSSSASVERLDSSGTEFAWSATRATLLATCHEYSDAMCAGVSSPVARSARVAWKSLFERAPARFIIRASGFEMIDPQERGARS